MARRVVVEYVAELAAFRRNTRAGADDVRRLADESRRAQVDVAEMGRAGSRAAAEVSESARRAADSLRDARGRFVAAGADAGRAFGDGFTRDASGRIRDARGRLVSDGRAAGQSAGSGFGRGFAGAVGDLASLVPAAPLLLLAGGAGAASGALQVIPPVLSAIAGGLAAIPALAAGAAGALGTLSLGTFGVGDALSDVFDPPTASGGGGGGDRGAAGARALESAERSLARAQRDSKLAQQEVTRARRDAARELRDLGIALGRLALDERDAALSVREAGEALAEAKLQAQLDPTAVTQTELERAQLAYDQAVQSQIEVSARAKDLREDQAAAAKAGVEGSEQVQAALRRQADAADQVRDAMVAVVAAQAAMSAGVSGGGVAKTATAYDKLSGNARRFVDEVGRLKPELVGLQQLAQDRIFAGLDRELRETGEATLPFLRRQVILFGDDWNATFKQLGKVARDPIFQRGLEDAFGAADRFLDGFNDRIPALGSAFGKVLSGSVPLIDRVGGKILGWLDDWTELVDRAASDGSMARWFDDAADQAEALLDIGKELAVIVGRIGGSQQGSTLLRDMADALHRFNEAGTQSRDVAAIIETGNAALKGMVDVLGTVGSALGDALADPGTRDAVAAFFSVLGVGADIVAGLVRSFAALPDPIQSVVLAGAGLALLTNRLSGAWGTLTSKLGAANRELRASETAGERASKGLDRAGAALGRVGFALGALQVTSAVFGSSLNPQLDALTTNLVQFGRDGEASGEVARLFGEDLGMLDMALKDVADTGAWSTFARGTAGLIEGLTGLGSVMDDSLTKSRERLAALDSTLKGLVESGRGAEAAAVFEQVAASASRQGVSVAELMRVLPEYAGSVDGVTVANRLAATAASEFEAALRGQEAALISAMEAEIGAAAAFDLARETIERNGRAWDTNTEAGRENQRSLIDFARAANEAALAKLRETASVEEANAVYEENRRKLYNLALQATGSKEKAKELTAQLLKVPDVSVAFETPGLATAVRLAREYNAELDRIRRNIAAGGFGVGGNFLGQTGYRWGGVVEHNRWGGLYQKAEVGLLRDARIYSARNPGRYMIAEPATRGEAFIPKAGNLERSVSIGRRAMEWYGHAVVPKSALAALRYGTGMTVAPSGPSASDIASAVGQVLGPAIAAMASTGSGDVVLTVDGVEIARATRAGERSLGRRG